MNPIIGIIYKLGRLHDIFDPLLGQRRYAQRTLRDKRNTITFIPYNSSMSLKIKELWGKSNAWFDFYNTVGDSSKTYLNLHHMCNGSIFGDETTTKEMITQLFINKKSQKWKELLT